MNCCVTGHRNIPEDKIPLVKQQLDNEIRKAIDDGFKVFISGFAEGADLLFAEIVTQYKTEHPQLFLEAAIPYPNRIKNGSQYFRNLLQQCNGIKTVSDSYHPQCFEQRNRYMVQHSDRIISVYDGREKGGTLFTMRYAHHMGKEVHVIHI